MVDLNSPSPVIRTQPTLEISKRNRKHRTRCRRGSSIDRMNLAVEEIRIILRSSRDSRRLGKPILIEFKFRPIFLQFRPRNGATSLPSDRRKTRCSPWISALAAMTAWKICLKQSLKVKQLIMRPPRPSLQPEHAAQGAVRVTTPADCGKLSLIG
jgi:hypothetical protein